MTRGCSGKLPASSLGPGPLNMALLGRVMRMTGALVFIAKDVGVVAEQSTEADHGHGKTTRVECLTTAANQPFTLEVNNLCGTTFR